MSLKVVSFDCAGTLVNVRWNPARLAMECAEHCGFVLPETAMAVYSELYGSRIESFRTINLQRSEQLADGWWRDLTQTWCERVGIAAADAATVYDAAVQKMHISPFAKFELFHDAITGLDIAESNGFRLAVLSNWDVSLHRILKRLGIDERFEIVIASLEEGVEKPDKELFDLLCSRLAVEPQEILHVGDDPIDDGYGAENAGLRSVVLDRSLTQSVSPTTIRSLTELDEAIKWNR